MLSDLEKQRVRQFALEEGFLLCGFAKAGFLKEEATRLENWLSKGFHGKMGYLENHFDMRVDPRKLVPNAKTIISFAFNYFPEKIQNPESPKIAKYAYGKDYHFVLKEKLFKMVEWMQTQYGEFAFRVFVDSGPVLERAWGEKAGLGWIGKHGLLINKDHGSWFFLAEIILDLEFSPDFPYTKDYCGTCNKCVEACPTEAILPNKTLNASQCISYLTIELKEQIPSTYKKDMNGWVFGCDICQDVCPWTRFSKPHKEPDFLPKEELLEMNQEEWKEITQETFKYLFKKSAIQRAGFVKLKQNIDLVVNDTDRNGKS
jgi:epoxyqueuosine reductase